MNPFVLKVKKLVYYYMPDSLYLKIQYKKRLGKTLNLKNPRTFNEKIQWLKLYDRRPIYTTMVDKFEAKKYVASIIGEEYIIPTLGVWEHFDDIDFDSLPNQFVLKCTHDSGGLVIVKDKEKMDREKAKEKIENSLKTNYYKLGREWPYKNVKRRIIAEQYMEDSKTKELRDYKFFAFNGKPMFILACSDRFEDAGLAEDFFTCDWEPMNLKRPNCRNRCSLISKPEQLQSMLNLATILSSGIPFIRVDFYIVNDRIYFGELTMYPASGFTAFVPENADSSIGDMIELPIRK